MWEDFHRANVGRGYGPTSLARRLGIRDTLIVLKLDRLARSMKQLIETIEKEGGTWRLLTSEN
jgi:hypothetical protein